MTVAEILSPALLFAEEIVEFRRAGRIVPVGIAVAAMSGANPAASTAIRMAQQCFMFGNFMLVTSSLLVPEAREFRSRKLSRGEIEPQEARRLGNRSW